MTGAVWDQEFFRRRAVGQETEPTRRGAELAADIRGTDCAVIVTDEAYGDLLDGLSVPRILDAGGAEYAGLLSVHHGAHRGAAAAATAEGLDPGSALLLLFTSGSTGAPKAVICSTGRWAFICQVNPIAFSCDDVAYNAMPIFHGNALMSAPGTPEGALGVPQQGFAVEIVNARGETCPPARFDADGGLLNSAEAIGEIVSRGAAARFEGSENFAAASVERILTRFPGVTAAAVYPVPDPVTGDQVMAALECPGGAFDPGAFWSFLGEQPDLGTKWAPRLIRVTARLPETATHKISKPALRRLLWHGEDPVYERTGSGYLLMTADRQGALEAEYARHGRDRFRWL